MKHTLEEIQNAFIRSAERALRKKMFKTGKSHIEKLRHKKCFNLNCKQLRTSLQKIKEKILRKFTINT